MRDDIDHEQLKPAAWRAENYLEGDDEADYDVEALVRAGPLKFPKMPDRNDHMARQEDVDDYAVRHCVAVSTRQVSPLASFHWSCGFWIVKHEVLQCRSWCHVKETNLSSRDHDLVILHGLFRRPAPQVHQEKASCICGALRLFILIAQMYIGVACR